MEEEDEYGTFEATPASPLAQQPVTASGPCSSNRKWFMVAILSILTCLNQMICFSFAPVATIAEQRWNQAVDASDMITVSLVVYVPCAFLGSWFMDKYGLRAGLVTGGFVQAMGSTLRYLACFLSPRSEATVTLFGQLLAATAAPFM
ncbi:TPA: hypothetical protein N0F65_003427 [Lagenidium giganteum]|uniref:Major facilitator superfamily (MFS) profile domain-containing protein n=1 Tax=Lagenidium giganteum TaxID=4803 RepID=A0AAV2YMC1_9STRA|nr:TPA: hypothetical protein N0F65_003427 [Lagenidium giganteum]